MQFFLEGNFVSCSDHGQFRVHLIIVNSDPEFRFFFKSINNKTFSCGSGSVNLRPLSYLFSEIQTQIHQFSETKISIQ